MTKRNVFVILLMSVLTTACNSLGTVSRSQAEQGIELMSSLQLELDSFRAEEEASEAAIAYSAQIHKEALVSILASENEDKALLTAARADSIKAAMVQMTDLLRTISQSDVDEKRSKQASLVELKEFLAPLPNTAKAVAESQKKYVALAEPLSTRVKLGEFQEFTESILQNIKDNKEKVKAVKLENAGR